MDKKTLEKVKVSIDIQIKNITKLLNNEINNNNEKMIYRNAKVLVFIESIKTNIEGYYEFYKDKPETIEKLFEYILSKENSIEEIYKDLYESNGLKFDLFMDRVELKDLLEFFLNINEK